jgi:SAM-dependent methyltransferase
MVVGLDGIASWCAERTSVELMTDHALEGLERRDSVIPDWVRARVICPRCRGDLSWESSVARCAICGSYRIEEGVPILIVGADVHKAAQASFFDEQQDDEFEIMRPRGTPRLYRWCIQEKFAISLAGLRLGLPPEAVGLTVCGGSGMDAEFLAREGLKVISSDLSPRACKRAAERARRTGLPLYPIVADVERLPVKSQGVDIVLVHDGLHHLEDPLIGLGEMTRVTRKAVALSEPAAARLTQLAVRVGLAHSVEEAGNRVARLHPGDVADRLRREGFHVAIRRCALVYRHKPGRASRLLSLTPLFEATRLMFQLLNLAVGRWGNKMSICARRGQIEGGS